VTRRPLPPIPGLFSMCPLHTYPWVSLFPPPSPTPPAHSRGPLLPWLPKTRIQLSLSPESKVCNSNGIIAVIPLPCINYGLNSSPTLACLHLQTRDSIPFSEIRKQVLRKVK
jgi:hypothetical protein